MKNDLVENVCCETRKELELREAEIIKSANCVNCVIAKTKEQYKKLNSPEYKEKKQKYLHDYRLQNKERISEYNKSYNLKKKNETIACICLISELKS